MKKSIWASAAAILIGATYFIGFQPRAMAQSVDGVAIELSELALAGQELYNDTCADCHGVDLNGTDKGPGFLNGIYAAGHHSDMAFILAVKMGTRAHHWRFGPMPPQDGFTNEQIGEIITYIRELQAANGF